MAEHSLKNSGDDLNKCSCDYTLNVLKSNVPVLSKQKLKRKRRKTDLQDLSKKNSVSNQADNHSQKWFLSSAAFGNKPGNR